MQGVKALTRYTFNYSRTRLSSIDSSGRRYLTKELMLIENLQWSSSGICLMAVIRDEKRRLLPGIEESLMVSVKA
ncbi:hypothetical protein GCM10010911_00810 [Paenibacillus nasutitermitis]|uniref:Uncharacterized protein n=1 Tax=Paenibacillus nasutitermitis TaxID=1652958 RepID=A0A916YIN2_9BACL|nr:hypothetical protein GCM10010911_00810 [Paenibacillus nasutitermitis]